MSVSAFRYVLFPHTVVPETYLRHLSILLPQLTVLQALRPASAPDWAGDFVVNWPVIEEQALLSKLKAYLKGFQDLATLKGMDGILASFAAEWGRSDPRESRFQIESRLRGVSPELADPKEWLRLEAAVFLELARDYDEREMDLASSFSRVDKLDEEFREILVITDEEDVEEIPDALRYSLSPDQGHLSFMLARRIALWYRLLATRLPREPYVPVAIAPAAVEEITESARPESAVAGEEAVLSKVLLARIPALDRMDPGAFVTLRDELQKREDLTACYVQELDSAVGGSKTSLREDGPGAQAELLRTAVEQLYGRDHVPSGREVRLSMIRFSNLSHDQIWKQWDKAGYELWGGALASVPSSSVVLCLE